MTLLLKLSKKLFLLVCFCFFLNSIGYTETKDIWQKSKEITIDQNQQDNSSEIKKRSTDKDLPQTVFDKQNIDLGVQAISQSKEINDNEVIFGLYEPDQTKIDLNIWAGLDLETFSKTSELILRSDKKSLNALVQYIFFTKNNLNAFDDKGKLYLQFITDWLIKNEKMDLIDQVINQNKLINKNPKFLEFLFGYYLSNGSLDKACGYTSLMTQEVESVLLDKYKIFCHVHKRQIKQAQSKLDLYRETRKADKFFINKINFLTGLSDKPGDNNFDNIFNAHLSIITSYDLNLSYENFSKNKELRNYFFNSGLANKVLGKSLEEKNESNQKKFDEFVLFLERSVNENLYDLNQVLNIYKKYNFSFAQLLNPQESSQKLKRPESHAILYQAALLAQDSKIKLEILKTFKDKLTLNGLKSIGEPVFFNELAILVKKDPKIIDEKQTKELEIFLKNNSKVKDNYNNNFLYTSKVRALLDDKTDKKLKKEALNTLSIFSNKIKKGEYKLNAKDVALINVLNQLKIGLPSDLKKEIYAKDIYIPNEIFNAMEKKSDNLVMIKTITFISNLKESDSNYIRDFLAIIKIFDNMKLDYLKKVFVQNEFKL